ncbi:MAG: tRNA (guanosine(46)-N7)-methyltransferase TrmB [Clostridia bacterium]|nr:tRNA (guanosine(46)-N7)-methyltransferase TrmB [Clostridia bacterium]
MRMRTKKWAKKELAESGFYINNPTDYIGKWRSLFKNDFPLHLELGCGKGIFTSKIAKANPQINYIGVDLSTDVLGVCSRNIKSTFDSDPIDNILITNFNIEKIESVFNDLDIINRIYINFCNPWPKAKHNKRRLTHPTKLSKYKTFLQKGQSIYFKTDDDELFESSIDYFNQSSFKITRLSYDLRNENYSDPEPNITTEHEEMFVSKGIKIKFLEAQLL